PDDGDEGLYFFGGVRRNGSAPLLFLKGDPKTLRFEILDDLERLARNVFSAAQRTLWNSLGQRFTWSEALDCAEGKKSLLSGMLARARVNGLVTPVAKGTYEKVASKAPQQPEPPEENTIKYAVYRGSQAPEPTLNQETS